MYLLPEFIHSAIDTDNEITSADFVTTRHLLVRLRRRGTVHFHTNVFREISYNDIAMEVIHFALTSLVPSRLSRACLSVHASTGTRIACSDSHAGQRLASRPAGSWEDG